ncbi:MAG: DUF1573 domain-containing protein [Planctomycetaceae bacterium]
MSHFIRSLLFGLVLAAVHHGVCVADQFTDAMISTDKVDFGVIATGSDVQKFIEVRNVHQEAYQIGEVKTSCSCAKASIDKTQLQPGEVATITVQMNTKNFRQRKDSNVLLSLKSARQLHFTEVRIPVTAYIRTDVVFNPGAVQFGEIELGNRRDCCRGHRLRRSK